MKRLLSLLLLFPTVAWANDNPITSMPHTTPATPVVLQSGVNVTQDGDYLVLPLNGAVVAVEALLTGTATLQAEVSFDTVNWYALPGNSISNQTLMTTITSTGAYVFDTGGWFYFRTRISNYVSGTVTVNAVWSEGSHPVAQSVGGSVTFPATQTVTANSLPLPTGAASSANQTNGSQVTQVSNFPSTQNVAVQGTASVFAHVENFPATQPVSATSLPLPTGAATSAIQTNGSQVTQVSNFPASQTVNAFSLPLPTNAAQETGGNLATIVTNQTSGGQKTQVTNFPVTQGVSGTVTGNQGTPNSTANSWPMELTTGGTGTFGGTTHPMIVTPGAGVAFPVSAAALPLPAGAATAANQTNGSQITQVTGTTATDQIGRSVAVISFQQAVTASAATLPSNSGIHSFCVKNEIGSTQTVYVGPAGVTITTGDELAPGDWRCYAADNTNRLSVVAAATGATVTGSGN
jgi:hypothetical protein